MLISEITQILPASLEWMVLFDLATLKSLADDNTVKQMFFLPESVQLDLFSHVILTEYGAVLAPHQGSRLVNSQDGSLLPISDSSLYDRFNYQLDQFPLDEADCLGVGEIAPFFPPVLLHLQIKSGKGEARAIFFEKPLQLHYELLQAVGVKLVGGEKQDSHYIAHFTVDLSTHLRAGKLAGFTRTGHCNIFFLQHGSIIPTLEAGLIKAVDDRVIWARDLGYKSVAKLGEEACQQAMPMTCQPPPPREPFPFGDLVPLGFLLRALNTAPSNSSASKARKKLIKLLLDRRQGDLWPFHSGDIATSTDSALVLQGISDPKAVQALEKFSDGSGGYYPQLWAKEGKPGIMVIGDWTSHWCQPDFATTCLVRALRRDAGLATKTTTDYLVKSFANRSGLYFANPYLVDWALASAIRGDESAAGLRARLLGEILSSMNEDYSFGRFDVPLSTAFAILSLAVLDYRDRTLKMAQLRLTEFMSKDGLCPESIPFYSTLKLPFPNFPASKDETRAIGTESERHISKVSPSDQVVQVNDQYFAISYYIDSHRILTTAVVTLALSKECESTSQAIDKIDKREAKRHPRYRCHNHLEYITTFALPPYISDLLPEKFHSVKNPAPRL